MIIEPKIMNNVCLTTHPIGCQIMVKEQIEWTKEQKKVAMPKRVLVIGCSTGYGLASRVVSAFSGGAATVGVSFEKEPSAKRPGTPGWYNNNTFDSEAKAAGLKSVTLNGDAFSKEVKEETCATVKEVLGKVDLIVYSLASPVRKDPETGETYRSVLKPIGKAYTAKSVDFMTGEVKEVTIDPAEEGDVEATTKVMGGEDWKLWIEALKSRDLLAEGACTVAYSYIGPELTFAVYRDGTIGRAKEHLEASVAELDKIMAPINGKSYVSVNKALVTRASAVIPVVPLYMALLFKIMKEKGTHEGCIEQIYRLCGERLYGGDTVPVDEKGRIRIDDWEMDPQVQNQIAELWANVDSESLKTVGDLEGFKTDYLQLHGFAVEGIDYTEDVNPE